MQFILASQSPQRARLLETLPYRFKVFPADIDESAIKFKNPRDKAKKIALAKAKAVLEKVSGEAMVVAADTFCLCQGKILEKPKSKSEAREMLDFQNQQEFEAITGYAFIYQNSHKKIIKNSSVSTRASFRHLSSLEIENYITYQPVLTWSAAFSPAYDAGMALLAWSKGNLTAFTHGLPIDLLVNFINQHLNLGVDNKHHADKPEKNSG
jgi:septum formation protein